MLVDETVMSMKDKLKYVTTFYSGTPAREVRQRSIMGKKRW